MHYKLSITYLNRSRIKLTCLVILFKNNQSIKWNIPTVSLLLVVLRVLLSRNYRSWGPLAVHHFPVRLLALLIAARWRHVGGWRGVGGQVVGGGGLGRGRVGVGGLGWGLLLVGGGIATGFGGVGGWGGVPVHRCYSGIVYQLI